MIKISIATLALVAAGLAHADYGDMRLYDLMTYHGADTLRVTEIDSVTIQVQQCDKNGVGCGQAEDLRRPNAKAKTWSRSYPGNTMKPDMLTFTAKGNLIFTTSPPPILLDDEEASAASLLRAVYRPR